MIQDNDSRIYNSQDTQPSSWNYTIERGPAFPNVKEIICGII